MYQPEPSFQSFTSLMTSIENGQIKIPQFQRQFVWSKKNSARLLDSIVKGYPIGTFIFWRTKESLRSIRNIGNISLPVPKDGEYVDYVLDGQQRLTSMFASFKSLNIQRADAKDEDFAEMYINLDATIEEEIVTTEINGDAEDLHYLKVSDLIYGGIKYLSSFPEKYLEKIDMYKTRIKGYNFPVVQIKEAPIDVATEVFTRLNVGGKALTLFEIMVAKTYDHELKFDLADEFDKMIEELRPIEFDTIASATVLQVVAILLKKECTRRQILKLDKKKFINIWPEAKDAIFRTLEYFKNHYRIPVSQLLPYNALIVPFAYFFFKHKDKPTGLKQKYLQDYFWRCAIGVRFSSGVENKLAQDVERIDLILKDKQPKYDWAIDNSAQYIKDNGWFSAGRSFIKAILCIYTYHQPKSFNDNSIVNIGNQYLKQANSKNYHHFFPKAYLRKNNEPDFHINHVLNITIVDDFLNKREIKAKAPAQYMAKFLKQNPDIEETMKTHCIRGLDRFGIWENDYDKFFDQRAKLVSRELNKRIITQDADQGLTATKIYDDYEQTDVEN